MPYTYPFNAYADAVCVCRICMPCMYALYVCLTRTSLVARAGAARGGRRGEDGQLAPCRRDQGRRCPLHWRGGDLCGNRGRKVRQLWHFHMPPHEASADLIAVSCSFKPGLSPWTNGRARAGRGRKRGRQAGTKGKGEKGKRAFMRNATPELKNGVEEASLPEFFYSLDSCEEGPCSRIKDYVYTCTDNMCAHTCMYA